MTNQSNQGGILVNPNQSKPANRPSANTQPGRTAATLLVLLLAGSALVVPGTAGNVVRPALAADPVPTNVQNGLLAGEPFTGSFEQNQGQFAPEVLWMARMPGMAAYLTQAGAVLLPNDAPSAPLTLQFIGASPTPAVTGEDPRPGVTNYLLGNESTAWLTGIESVSQVRMHDIYPGIDVLFYIAASGQLEFDTIVGPGVDPSIVRFEWLGGSPTLGIDGGLVIASTGPNLLVPAPAIYQVVGQERQTIYGSFNLVGQTVGFKVGTYDHSRPLVIDPQLSYSSFLGGANTDAGNAIAFGPSNTLYVAGTTASNVAPVFPSTSGAYRTTFQGGATDAFVSKFTYDPVTKAVALAFSTYLGGSLADSANAIVLDSAGNAYITGSTTSTNFPLVNAIKSVQQGGADIFVSEISASGSVLMYSTYFGERGNDAGYSLALRPDGTKLAVVGVQGCGPNSVQCTATTLLPTTSNAYQTTPGPGTNAGTPNPCCSGDISFVMEISLGTSWTLPYSTLLGQTTQNFPTIARDVAYDAVGRIYVVGITPAIFPGAGFWQVPFPTTPNAHQTTTDPGGAGGGPTLDGFISKFDTSASGQQSLLYSSFLSGALNDAATALIVTAPDTAWVAGYSTSTNLVVGAVQTPFQTSNGGGQDGFLLAVNTNPPTGDTSLIYGSYLGGTGTDSIQGLALDGNGNFVMAGSTDSTSGFPIKSAIYPTVSGGQDGFVLRLDPDAALAANQLLFSSYLGGKGTDVAPAVATSGAYDIFLTGSSSRSTAPFFPTTSTAIQGTQSAGIDAFLSIIGKKQPSATFTATTPVLTSGSIALTPTYAAGDLPVSGFTYEWDYGNDGTVDSTVSNPGTITAPNNNGNYDIKLTVKDSDGDVAGTTVVTKTVVVQDRPPVATFSATPGTVAAGGTVSFAVTSSSDPDGTIQNPAGYEWDFDYVGATFTTDATGTAPSRVYPTEGTYQVRLRATDDDGSTALIAGTVTVTHVNTAPVVIGQSATTAKNTDKALTFGFTDPDATDTQTFSIVQQPMTGASVTQVSGASWTYHPKPGFSGSDSFKFKTNDGNSDSNTATVLLTITNQVPVAQNGAKTLPQDAATALTLVATDGDALDSLTYSVSAPMPGATVLGGPGSSWTYTPKAGTCGTDSFTFTASDGTATSNTATYSLTITCATNNLPTAADQAVTVARGVAKPITLVATDPDAADTLTYTTSGGPMSGATLTGGPGSTWTYTPKPGYSGADSFKFIANDGHADSNTATVTITVTNQIPVANGQSVTTNKNANAAITLVATDGDPTDVLQFSLVQSPMMGATVTGSPTSGWTYTPKSGYIGADSFTFSATDGTANSNIATVSITVINHAPVAAAQSVNSWRNTDKALTLAATDQENDALTFAIVGAPMPGASVSGGPGTSWTYHPKPGYYGTDSFTFKANDGTVDSTPATVTVTVVDNPPVAADDPRPAAAVLTCSDALPVYLGQTTAFPRPGSLGVLSNDRDADQSGPGGDALHATLLTQPAAGTVTMTDAGAFSYSSPGGSSGTLLSFRYKVADSAVPAATATATVSLCLVDNVPPHAGMTSAAEGLVGQGIAFSDASNDPIGAIVSWSWDFGDGVTSAAKDPGHAFADPGVYQVRHCVTDDAGASDCATYSVHVSEAPHAVASSAAPPSESSTGGSSRAAPARPDAGIDLAVIEGTRVTMHGTFPPELHAQWQVYQGPQIELRNATSPTMNFVAPAANGREYHVVLSLVVSDGLDSEPDYVDVLVQPHPAPRLDARASYAWPQPGSNVTLFAGGVAQSYAWTQIAGPRVQLMGADGANASFQAPTGGSDLWFRLDAKNGPANATATLQVVVRAEPAKNAAPVEAHVATVRARISRVATHSSPMPAGALTALALLCLARQRRRR